MVDDGVIVVIMAGGAGKRMNSSLPKVLHHVLNKPMLVHVVETAMGLNPRKILIVVGQHKTAISETLDQYNLLSYVEFVHQEHPQGTGHAVQCCRDFLNEESKINTKVLILSGDVPLIKQSSLEKLMDQMTNVRIMTTCMDDPHGYGRIIEKDGIFDKIVEEKDCNDEQRVCKKVNAGIYCFNGRLLHKYLPLLQNNNAQQEYYLTDIVELIKNGENVVIESYDIPIEKQIEIMGVNNPVQLEELNKKTND